MKISLNERQTRLLRLHSQCLIPLQDGPAFSPAQVLEASCGVQAQDLPSALLAIRARSTGLTAADVEKAQQDDRSIVWTWCQRGTLHLLSTVDLGWLVPLLGPIFIASNRRRFLELGWDDDLLSTGVRLMQAELPKSGSLTRPEIAQLLEDNRLPFKGQATVYLLFRAALEGVLCLGPTRDRQQTYVLTETWIGKPIPLPCPEALAKLARRYLEAYAPSSPEDLASWSGIKLHEARQAWELIADLTLQIEAAGRPAWMLKSRLDGLEDLSDPNPVVRLLPRFDTYLLGYVNRDLVVDPAYARLVNAGGGMISATVSVDGQILGTWSTRRRSSSLEINIRPFESFQGDLLPLIEAEVADIGRFLGVNTAWGIIR